MKAFRLLAGLAFLLFACSDSQFPEQPEPPTAQFFMAGEINSSQISLTAGEEDYFMFTDYAYDEDEQRFVYQGRLSKLFCINCGNALAIEIRDSVRRPDSHTFGDELPIMAKDLPYKLTLDRPGVQFQFTSSVDTSEAQSYFWDFGDGIQSRTRAPLHIFDTEGQDRATVTHRVVKKDSCASQVESDVEVFPFGNVDDSCKLDFVIMEEIVDSTVRRITLEPTVTDFGQRFYLWQIFVEGQNEIFKSSEDKVLTFFVENEVITQIKLITEDISCSGEVTKSFEPKSTGNTPTGIPSICDISFDQQRQFVLAPAPEPTSEVCISWVSDEGLEYRSDRFAQPSASSFTITSVEPFEENDRGQKTLKLGITFSCQLANEQGEVIWVEDMNGIFGVAFP